MNSDGVYFVFTIFLFFSIYMAVAITLFIVYKLLNKYNNFGDTTCNLDEYSPWGIKYSRMRDDVLIQEVDVSFLKQGIGPHDGVVFVGDDQPDLPEVIGFLDITTDDGSGIDVGFLSDCGKVNLTEPKMDDVNEKHGRGKHDPINR